MPMEAHDFFKEATLGLAFLALAFVTTHIDAKSMFGIQATPVLSMEKMGPLCKATDQKKSEMNGGQKKSGDSLTEKSENPICK